jgi:hypothetical protein
MCDPVVTPIALATSAALSAAGSIAKGNATASADRYNANVADLNSKQQTQNATWAAQAGDQQAAMSQQKTRATVGAITANQAASGIETNTGSAVAVRAGAAENGMLDAMTIRSNAARQAYGYQVQAASDKAQASQDRSEASDAETAGYIGAGSSVLGAAANPNANWSSLSSGGSSGGTIILS